MATIDTNQLFERGEKLLAEREANFEATAAVRDTLRNLRDSRMLSGGEVNRLEKLFPTRARSDDN